MAAMDNPLNERGQSHIAATCIALALFSFALFFLIQICWVGYQSLSFDHALYQTSWQLDQQALDKIKAGGDVGGYVSEAILADWTQIDPDDLTVEGATCTVDAKTSAHDLSGTDDNEALLIERATQTVTTARIAATATLHVKLLFPVLGIDEVSLVRSIDKAQQISTRFEVS